MQRVKNIQIETDKYKFDELVFIRFKQISLHGKDTHFIV